MSDDEVVASDVPLRFLFSPIPFSLDFCIRRLPPNGSLIFSKKMVAVGRSVGYSARNSVARHAKMSILVPLCLFLLVQCEVVLSLLYQGIIWYLCPWKFKTGKVILKWRD